MDARSVGHLLSLTGLAWLAICARGSACAVGLDHVSAWLAGSTVGVVLVVAGGAGNRNFAIEPIRRRALTTLVAHWLLADGVIALAILVAGLSLTAADSLLAVSFGLEAGRVAALVAMAAIFLRLGVPPFHQVLSQLAESRAAVFVALAVTACANLVVLCRFLLAMTNQLHFSGAALAKVVLCTACICAGAAVWQSSVRCRLLTIARAWGLALASAVCMQPSTPGALQMASLHFAMIIAAVLAVGLFRTTAFRRNPIAWFCTASMIGAPFTAGGATLCRIATTHSSVAPSLLWLLAAMMALVGIAAYRTLTSTAVAVGNDADLAPRFDSSPLGWLLQFHWASPALAAFVLFGGTVGILDSSVKNPTPAASAQPAGTKVTEK